MDISSLLKKWLEIDYYYIANKIGFINSNIEPDYDLISNTIRAIDHETIMVQSPNTNMVISILALMWEHIDKSKYNISGFILKILTRIGYPTSAIITDSGYDAALCQFSSADSAIDKITLTAKQLEYEINVGKNAYLLTEFQKQLWDSLDKYSLVGISAPTSAGKSFIILLKTVERMLSSPCDIIYIVPTLSLLNQVTEDYHKLCSELPLENYLITSDLTIGESKAANTIYILTQEKAMAIFSLSEFNCLPNKTIVVVDEIQNVERLSEESDIRAKILYDSLQEIRHIKNVEQIIISGPRITQISNLGKSLFGKATHEVTTLHSPVLNLTYSVEKRNRNYYFKQYCGCADNIFEDKIEDTSIISGYGSSSISDEYISYLHKIVNAFQTDQNIIFAPTAASARKIALSLPVTSSFSQENLIDELISYYKETVNPNYSLCDSLSKGVAYHHGKLPVHVRRTIEKAVRKRIISNIVCTTTLMQGVNLPAQNVIIRNPHLYTRHSPHDAELSSYEMANLRGRAGRLLKDFIGRTIVLDEGEFVQTDGYDQISLFDDIEKEVSSGYGEKFNEYKGEILTVANSNAPVNNSMANYGYLVTYIRQSVLRYGRDAKNKMAETGVTLTQKQVAAIILKLKELSVPKKICIQNRYWDPFVLDKLYSQFNGKVPNHPAERGAKTQLADMLKFLRENDFSSDMYNKYIPEDYRSGAKRHMLCDLGIKWANGTPLSSLLSANRYNTVENASENIEDTIKLLHESISFKVPLLIKPIVEMHNENSSIVACLQAGAYDPVTRKMIEIGVPRELAIKLSSFIKPTDISPDNSYEFEIDVRAKVKEAIPSLPHWEQVQLDFMS